MTVWHDDKGLGLGLRLGLGLISREKELTIKPPCLSLAESIVRLSGGSVSLKAPQLQLRKLGLIIF